MLSGQRREKHLEQRHKEKAHSQGAVDRSTSCDPLERTVAHPLCVLNTCNRASHTVRVGGQP